MVPLSPLLLIYVSVFTTVVVTSINRVIDVFTGSRHHIYLCNTIPVCYLIICRYSYLVDLIVCFCTYLEYLYYDLPFFRSISSDTCYLKEIYLNCCTFSFDIKIPTYKLIIIKFLFFR